MILIGTTCTTCIVTRRMPFPQAGPLSKGALLLMAHTVRTFDEHPQTQMKAGPSTKHCALRFRSLCEKRIEYGVILHGKIDNTQNSIDPRWMIACWHWQCPCWRLMKSNKMEWNKADNPGRRWRAANGNWTLGISWSVCIPVLRVKLLGKRLPRACPHCRSTFKYDGQTATVTCLCSLQPLRTLQRGCDVCLSHMKMLSICRMNSKHHTRYSWIYRFFQKQFKVIKLSIEPAGGQECNCSRLVCVRAWWYVLSCSLCFAVFYGLWPMSHKCAMQDTKTAKERTHSTHPTGKDLNRG